MIYTQSKQSSKFEFHKIFHIIVIINLADSSGIF